MGGESGEREVSLMSGKEIIKNLDKNKYEVVAIELPKEALAAGISYSQLLDRIIELAK